MGTSLSGLTPATTFDGLLKTSDNDALDTTLKTIGTGDGTDSVLQLSNSALHIGGSATNETTDTWVEGFNSNLRLSANSPSMQFKDTSGTAGFMIGVSGASTFFSQSTNADFTAVSYVGKITGGKWNFGSSDTPTATVSVKGSGATSATTSLLVQNSAGSELFKVTDDGAIDFGVLGLDFSNDGSGGTMSVASDRYIKLASSLSTYSALSAHLFKTFDGSAYSEAMRITGNTDQFVGIGETTPTARLHLKGSGNDNTTTSLLVQNSDGTDIISVKDDLSVVFNSTITSASSTLRFDVGGVGTIRMNSDKVAIGGNTTPTARLHIKGSGATSATTALLVQNSAGTDMLRIMDGGADKVLRTSSAQIGSLEFAGANIGRGGGNPITFAGTNQIGIGVSTPTSKLHIQGSGNDATTTALLVQNSDGTDMVKVTDDGIIGLNPSDSGAKWELNAANNYILSNVYAHYYDTAGTVNFRNANVLLGLGTNAAPNTRVLIKGTGATSATTALLVENSAGTELLKIEDGGNIVTAGFTFQSNIIKPNINGYIGLNHSDNRTFSVIDSSGARTYLKIQSSSTSNFADVSINTDHLVVKKEGNVAVGTSTLDASAKLQVDSTTQGFLPPRMTTTERDAISTPAAGLMVYNTTTNKAQCYNGTAWQDLF